MQMTHLLVASTLMLAIVAMPACTDNAKSESDEPITIAFARTMHSDILDEDRTLNVYLPNGYDPAHSERYPLFFYLDGRTNVKATSSIIHALSEGGVIPRMVVVGISNTNRDRDLIPMQVVGNEDAGGGANFLASIKNEVIPYIDAHWPTNGFRTISGHSLGGLTVLNFLVNEPDLFDAYISLTPSMEVGDGLMLDQVREFLGGRKKLDRMLYLSIADEQWERIYFDQLVEFLEDDSPEGFLWESGVFEDEDDHQSIRVTGNLAGIRWVFRDWRLTSKRIFAMTSEEITAHYNEATLRFKQDRSPSMMEITDAGYWGLYRSDRIGRSMELFRIGIQMWPDEAYPHSALGEGLERTGKPEEALLEMELALEMGMASGDWAVPYYQEMVTRVRRKLGK